jgi:hypothetical protein
MKEASGFTRRIALGARAAKMVERKGKAAGSRALLEVLYRLIEEVEAARKRGQP